MTRSALRSGRARTLGAVYQTITLESDPLQINRAVQAIGAMLDLLDPRTRLEFGAALVLVENAPLWSRFSQMNPDARADFLESWRSGPAWRRPIFGALKEICYLHYYTQPAHWAAIGYGGPLLPPGFVNPELQARYQDLVAR